MKSAKARAKNHQAPLIAAVMALLLACGGYYLYRHLSMPKVQVKHVATQWLDKSAGKKDAKDTFAPHKIIRHQVKTKLTGHQSRQASTHPVLHRTTARFSPAAASCQVAAAQPKKLRTRHVAAIKGHHKKAHQRAVLAHAKVRRPIQNAAYRATN